MTGPGPVAVVALEVGGMATRLAGLGPDGRPEVAAVLPAGTTAQAALRALYGDAPIRALVLVHPAGSSPGEVAAATDLLAGRAATVCALPAPVAVLAGLVETGDDAGPRAGVGNGPARRADPECSGARSGEASVTRLVVDAGAGGTELTVVTGDRPLAVERIPVGGDRLDAVLTSASELTCARARAVREALSTRTEVTLPGPTAPVAGQTEAGAVWAGGTVVTAERGPGAAAAGAGRGGRSRAGGRHTFRCGRGGAGRWARPHATPGRADRRGRVLPGARSHRTGHRSRTRVPLGCEWLSLLWQL